MNKLRREKVYVAMYTLGDGQPNILCWSTEEMLLNEYIAQVESLDYKTGIDYTVVIISKANSDGLPASYELTSISEDILLTEMELRYYSPMFKSLYNDMRTTVSTLVLYNKLCGGSSDILNAISMVGLYNRCEDFYTFMNSMDRATILQTYIQHPIAIMDILIESYAMDKIFTEVIK